MNRLRSLRPVALLLLVTVLVSCGKKKEGGADNKYNLSTKNNVIWRISSDIDRLHPYTSNDANSSYVYQFIWEPLNGANPRTQELIPNLASLPEISADHKIYTYTMNPKAKWSDGKPLTGEDVMFSFKAVANPAVINAASIRGYMNPLDSVSFVGGDKMKVAFYMKEPYFQNDRVLGGGYVPIMPKHIFDPKGLTDKMSWPDLKSHNMKNPALQEWASFFESSDIARDPKYQIGSGPYLYKEWITNNRIVLTKNPNYWAKGDAWAEAYPDELIFKTISDEAATITSLKRKDIDLIHQVPAPQFVQLTQDSAKQPFISRDTIYMNSRGYLPWNNKRPLFSDKRVRRALTMLIDKDQIIKLVLKGQAIPVDGPINFTQGHYVKPANPIKFDPVGAKALLTEAGWADSDGDGILDKVINGRKTPFKFTLSLPAGNDVGKQILLVIAEQFRKNGIDAMVSSLEWSVFLENYRSQNFDAAFLAIAGNASEDDPYQLWHSSQANGKGSNAYSFINKETDAILEQNRVEFDYAKRHELMKRFQEILREEQPVTWLWCSPYRMARINRFDNVEFFRQRPGIAVNYWVVRGSGQKADPNAISTYKPDKETAAN